MSRNKLAKITLGVILLMVVGAMITPVCAHFWPTLKNAPGTAIAMAAGCFASFVMTNG